MKTSENGIEFLKEREGEKLFAYDDLVYPVRPFIQGETLKGTLTAGHGHTGPDVYAGMEVTKRMAEDWLKSDLAWSENKVTQKITERGLSQAQFDMLVSHTFNSGGSDTLFQRVNDWLRGLVPLEYVGIWWTTKYITSKGIQLPGLITRRADEWEIFEDGYNPFIHGKKNT